MPKLANKYLAESQEHLKMKIRQVSKVSEEALGELVALFEPCYFPKRTFIIKQNEQNKYMYFIHKGLVRVFYVREEKEINHWFDSDGDFIGNLYYVEKDRQSFHNYETLENTWMLRVKHSDLNRLFKKYPALESVAKTYVEIYYMNNLKQVIDIKSLSAETRYENFLRQFGELQQRIPQKQIANYLSITQETLSRIKSKK